MRSDSSGRAPAKNRNGVPAYQRIQSAFASGLIPASYNLATPSRPNATSQRFIKSA